MPDYKLVYFAGKGVAEKSRYLFAMAEVAYEDFRFPITMDVPGDFSTMKRPEFDKYKAEGKTDATLGVLPQLCVDGKEVLGQSKSIERYLAKQFGFFGATPWEEGVIDSITEHERDLKQAYQKVDKKDSAAVDKWWTEDFGAWMEKVEKCVVPLGSSDGGFFLVGGKLSLADLCFFHLVTDFFTESEKAKAVCKEKAPRVAAAIDAVGADPRMQKWLEARPQTPF